MKHILPLLCALFCTITATRAQEQPLILPEDSIRSLAERLFPGARRGLDAHMNLQFSTSGVANLSGGELEDASFKLNRVKLEILGSFNPKFSYHFRQSFNKYSNPYSLDNLSSSIEYALVNWHLSDRFTLTAGKQAIALGGYEYYVSAIKVREFSEFNNNIACYQAGVSGLVHMTPNQELVLQVVNGRSGEDNDAFLYGRPAGIEKAKAPILATANWNGYFCNRALQLRYAASWGQQAEGKNICYLTAGNIYEKGPVLAYIDLMYSREGLDSKGILSDLQGSHIASPATAQDVEYFTAIANFDYRIHPNWNIYVKGVYERANIYKANGCFEKGHYRTAWNAQACIEFYPLHNSELQLFTHFLYKGYHLNNRARALGGTYPDTQRISVGLVYAIPVF